jgi:glycosyltransferase involved in cell wall biosynthesis
VDTARFQPADSLPDGPLRLLFAGTPSLRKGVDLLPAILNAVRDDIRLSITADPDALPGLADHPQINFLGRVAPANMAETYRAHSALLMPTRMEGLPLAALEAMACGLPVIASDASSLPEAVLDGETGLLVPAGDAHGFAQAVAALHDNSDMRSRMGAAARRRAEGHFTLERMGRDYARVLGVSANA